MKRWLFALRLASLLSISVPALGSPVYVQGSYATPQTPAPAVSVAYGATETAGDLNVVVVGWNDTASTITSVTDTRGNRYSVAAPARSGTGLSQAIYYAPAIASGANTVTVKFNGAALYVDLRIAEYAGLTGSVDSVSSGVGATSPASVTAASTSSTGDLLISAVTTAGSVIRAAAGYSQRFLTFPNGDNLQDSIGPNKGPYFGSTPVSPDPWVEQWVAFNAGSTQTRETLTW
jgi:hypothetical protein